MVGLVCGDDNQSLPRITLPVVVVPSRPPFTCVFTTDERHLKSVLTDFMASPSGSSDDDADSDGVCLQ